MIYFRIQSDPGLASLSPILPIIGGNVKISAWGRVVKLILPREPQSVYNDIRKAALNFVKYLLATNLQKCILYPAPPMLTLSSFHLGDY